MRYNVPATVKKHSDGYEEFFTSPELVCLVEAFLEFFDMEAIESQPAKSMSRECKHGGQEATLITCLNNL